MAYIPTNWVDAVTPVDAVHMNKIEAELVALDVKPGMDLSYDGDWVAGTYQEGDTVVKDGIVWLCVGGPTTTPPDYTLWGTLGPVAGGGLPADTVVPAATRIVANKLLAGDAQPAFRFLGDGKHEWGPGGATAPDTNLYRSAAGVLVTDLHFRAGGQIQATGQIIANLSQANQITLAPGGQIFFGSAADTNLYRSSAGSLKTDGALKSGGSFTANEGVANQIQMAADGKIYFGNAYDTNLYRVGAGVLKTDGAIATGSYGTSLPASPVDGQEFTLVDSLTVPSYSWRFRYTASITDANKWIFVGGSDAFRNVQASEATTSGAYADLATVGPTFVIPRAGIYRVSATFATSCASPAGLIRANVHVDGVAGQVVALTGVGTNFYATGVDSADLDLAAGATLTMKYATSSGSSTSFWQRRLRVQPVRVA